MALISEESTSREIAGVNMVTVELDENDIPGAALSSPFERHTVPELKWWLMLAANLGIRLELALI